MDGEGAEAIDILFAGIDSVFVLRMGQDIVFQKLLALVLREPANGEYRIQMLDGNRNGVIRVGDLRDETLVLAEGQSDFLSESGGQTVNGALQYGLVGCNVVLFPLVGFGHSDFVRLLLEFDISDRPYAVILGNLLKASKEAFRPFGNGYPAQRLCLLRRNVYTIDEPVKS